MTNEATKATLTTVTIGSIEVDGFMLPDGSYRMSQTQATECVGVKRQNLSDFFSSKSIKALLSESYTDHTQFIEIEEEEEKHCNSLSKTNSTNNNMTKIRKQSQPRKNPQ